MFIITAEKLKYNNRHNIILFLCTLYIVFKFLHKYYDMIFYQCK